MAATPAAVDAALSTVTPQLLIGAGWRDARTGATLTSHDPATGAELRRVAHAGAADVDDAVRAARRAFRDTGPWRRMPPSRRGRLLHRLGDLILADGDTLALLDCLDNGKPLGIARRQDVALAADLFHYMAGWATKLPGETGPLSMARPDRYLALTDHEPVGVVAAITPWNFPLYMAAAKVAPALAAGCTVILKPAEQTPLSALRLGALALEAGLPPGVLNILTGGGGTGAALAGHDGVDKVTFTGSTEVGRKIVRASAGNLKRVSLELGGKSPAVVFADADLAVAVPGAAHAAFFNQGECCVAGSRLYVQRPVHDEVVAGIAGIAAGCVVGSGLAAGTQMGPLITAEHRERVTAHLDDARRRGARIEGGQQPAGPGWFLRPAVLTDVPAGASVLTEEVFGPVLTVLPFDDVDEVVTAANATLYGLAAGVFTRDLAKAHRVGRRLRAGTVWINTWHVLDPALPFGGFKQSGWGRELGRAGVAEYLETRTMITDLQA